PPYHAGRIDLALRPGPGQSRRNDSLPPRALPTHSVAGKRKLCFERVGSFRIDLAAIPFLPRIPDAVKGDIGVAPVLGCVQRIDLGAHRIAIIGLQDNRDFVPQALVPTVARGGPVGNGSKRVGLAELVAAHGKACKQPSTWTARIAARVDGPSL